MKKKFLVLISCLICCILFVTGCGVKPLVGGPNADNAVYGNGGMVVRKGEYVYFANAFSTQKDITTNENKYGDETLSAIYRVKLSDNGVVEYGEDGLPVGAEIMVKQISGFENSGLYIFGEHLYYATPYTLKNSDNGEDITGLIRFCRVKLDGTGWKVLYETKKFDDTASYFYTQVDGIVYLTIYDGEKLISVKAKGGNISNRVLVEEGVLSAKVYQRNDISTTDTLCEYDRYVYYTRNVVEEKDGKETGTVVARIKYTDNKAKEEVMYMGNNGYSVYEVKNNTLYLKLDSNLYSTNKTTFVEEDLKEYFLNSSLVENMIVVEDINATQTKDENGIIFENKEDKGVIAVWNKNMLIHSKGVEDKVVLHDASSTELTLTLLYVEDGYVYYTEGGETLFRKNISNPTSEAETVVTNISLTLDNSAVDKKYFDCDGDYVFFYKKVADTNEVNAYLHLAKAGNGYKDLEEKNVGKYIGVLDIADTEEKTEDTEEAE